MTVLPGLISLFWTVLLHQLINSSGPVPVTLLLDEFANTGKIPNLHAVARGRDNAIWLGLQSLCQLDAVYGKETTRTIRDNSTTNLALAGLDHVSAEEISRAPGEGTAQVTRTTRTPAAWLHTRVSYSGHGVSRRVLTADAVRRLPSDELLMISANRCPLRLSRVTRDWTPYTAVTTELGPERGLDLTEPNCIAGVPAGPPMLPDLPTPPVRPSRSKRIAPKSNGHGNR
jgi:type IV secretory pathway TraG/TraD family ATPase VirD4